MNVWVLTVDGATHAWDDVAVTYDTTVLEVTYGSCTTTFPLVNVIVFSTDTAEMVTP